MESDEFGPPLRDVIAAHGLATNKRLGQHFLLDLNLTRKIARGAAPLEDAQIIEIGPGPGGLTRALLMEGARSIIAIERDRRCVEALADLVARSDGRLTVVEGDALKLREEDLVGSGAHVKIVSNLPYNISTALLTKWLTVPQWPPYFESLTLMFQREVAERLIARPHTKDYGRLSVLTQWRMHACKLFDVPPQAFSPPPKVVSTVVSLVPIAQPEPAPLGALQTVCAAAFNQRRKMLRSSLKSLGPPEALLAASGIDGTLRAEDLDIPEFARLARTYAQLHDAP